MKTLILNSVIYCIMIVCNNLSYAQSYFINGNYTNSGEKVALAIEEMYSRNKFTKYRNEKENEFFKKNEKIYNLTVFREGLRKKVFFVSVKFNSKLDKFYRFNSEMKLAKDASATKISRLNFNVVLVFHLFNSEN